MDTATRPLVTPPTGSEPLKIELGRSDLDPGVHVDELTGPLLRKASVDPSDSGLVTIRLELTTSQVDVTDFVLEEKDEALVVIDIKPRRTAAQPDETAAPARPAAPVATRAQATPTPAPAAEGEAAPDGPALPAAAAPSPAEAASSQPLALPALRSGPAALSSAAQGQSLPPAADASAPAAGSLSDSLTKTDAFPDRLLALDFVGAQKMLDAYQAKNYAEAIKIGLAALRSPQSPESLDSLVYLLAECRFQQTRVYDLSTVLKRPEGWDWPEVQNYYEQARRFAPQSPFRPFADFRMSQIFGYEGDLVNHQAALQAILRRHELPNLPQVLMDLGVSALQEHAELPETTASLVQAVDAFKTYVDSFPDDPRRDDARFYLGEAYYQLGNDAEAYADMRLGTLKHFPVADEMHAHWGLAAHRSGWADISGPCRPISEVLNPAKLPNGTVPERAAQANEFFGAFVRNSQDPAVHLELARILDHAGNRREAMREYQRVVRGMLIPTNPDQLAQARRALALYGLEDRRTGTFDPNIAYDDYADPDKTLDEVYDSCYDPQRRTDLLCERVNQLFAEGRDGEAVQLVLTHLEPGRMAPQLADQLRQTLSGRLHDIMDSLCRSGDHLPAIRLYKAFENDLPEKPQGNDVLLDCARILTENDMRDQALRALDRLSPYEDLTPEQQIAAAILRRELSLDPANPEAFKRDGALLLKSDLDDAVRARVLRLLAGIYSGEGGHSYAAQLDREAGALKGLSLAERVGFYLEAARQYEAGKVNTQAVEAYYQAIYTVEEAGVAPVEAHDWYGPALIGMAQNFQTLGQYDQSGQACTQYLKYFPDGAQADLAHYTLGQSYEQRAAAGGPAAEARNLRAQALEQYETLAKARTAAGAPAVKADAVVTSPTFWQNVGQKSADQLRWEQDHPYLKKEEGKP